jgi:uncharacterized phage-associated protein
MNTSIQTQDKYTELYREYNSDQISKIGNTIVYLSSKIHKLSKTKLLKLLYILDELSIKQSGIPFLNLSYKTWKFGPVSEEIFIELSTEPTFLKDFFKRKIDSEDNIFIIPNSEFCDDEFSKNDFSLLDYVISQFGNKSAKELISYTHRKNAPWYNSAVRNSILSLLEEEKINSTEFLIDMSELIGYDNRKLELYKEYLENC